MKIAWGEMQDIDCPVDLALVYAAQRLSQFTAWINASNRDSDGPYSENDVAQALTRSAQDHGIGILGERTGQ